MLYEIHENIYKTILNECKVYQNIEQDANVQFKWKDAAGLKFVYNSGNFDFI